MIGTALMAVAVGVTMIRIGWNGRRSVAVLGWAVVCGASLVATWLDGAWGLATCTVTGMAAAYAALLWSALVAPGQPRRPEIRRTATYPANGDIGVARRLCVFLLVVPGGGTASVVLTFGIKAAARRAGASAADASALMLILLPLLWSGLLAWQMTRPKLGRMVALPLLAVLLGAMLLTHA